MEISVHQVVDNFLKNPTNDEAKKLLYSQLGESRKLEFKAKWPENDEIAKIVLAMGNSRGGCIFIGVEETKENHYKPVGVPNLKDKAQFNDSIQKFIPIELFENTEIADFKIKTKNQIINFQVVFIHESQKSAPHICRASGKNVKNGDIFIRREGQSIKATAEEIQNIINRRLLAEGIPIEKSLLDHCKELKQLYAEIPKEIRDHSKHNPNMLEQKFNEIAKQLSALSNSTPTKPNPKYPAEDYEDFIASLIVEKKMVIHAVNVKK